MRKFILFALALVGSIGVWGGYDVVYVKNPTGGATATYSDLGTAVNNVNSGGSIIFQSDIETSSGVTIGKSVTIDLKGYEYTCTGSGSTSNYRAILINSGSVNFKSTDPGTPNAVIATPSANRGKIYATHNDCKSVIRINGGTTNIDNIEFGMVKQDETSGFMCVGYSGSGVTGTVSNCKFITDGTYKGGGIYCYEGTITVDNCEADFQSTMNTTGGCISAAGGGTITIKSGTYVSKGAPCVNTFSSGGTITIEDGTYTNTSTTKPVQFSNSTCNYAGVIFCYNNVNDGTKNSKIIIENGTFNGYLFEGNGKTNTATIEIKGGTFSSNDIYKGIGHNPSNPIVPSTTTSVKQKAGESGAVSYFVDNGGVITTYVGSTKPGDYIRNVTSGSWGTCVFSEKVTVSGAEVYKLLNMDSTGIYLEQVTGVIPVETAFFFKATGSQLILNVSDGAAISMAANGLHGTLEAMNWPEKSNTYTGLTGKYLLTYHDSAYKLAKAADGSSLPPYRAYVVWSEVQDLTPQKAMGRRIRLGANGESEVTGVEDVVSENTGAKIEKFIQNAKLYIRRGNELYDAQGARIK